MRAASLLSALLTAAFAGACVGSSATDEAERPPNVLLIVADDQGYADLSCAGLAPDVDTPALDRLAADGVRFTRAYATSPICNASRAGLMTGCYQQRFGTFWYGGEGLRDADFPTLAELLRERGYATGYVGKFHYGGHHVHQPESRSFPLRHGFDSFYGFAGGRKHYLVHTAEAEAAFQETKREHERQGQSLQQGPFWEGARQVDQEGFSTELLGARAREFMRVHAERPFFLMVAFNAVHNFTHQLPEEYLTEHGLTGHPGDWNPAAQDYYEWYRTGRFPNNHEGRAQYLGQLHFLDREVGRLLDELDDLGLARRTIVVYVGDNGGSTPIYADNGPLRGSKYTLYEGGVRVPLILTWPGRGEGGPEGGPGRGEGGQVLDNVVSAMDLLPTLCAATGARVPAFVDGNDLGPLLRGIDPNVRQHTLVWDTQHEWAVRQGRWKLHVVRSARHADYEMVELELGTFLHDLDADPGEAVNLARDHPELVEQLAAVHSTWRGSL